MTDDPLGRLSFDYARFAEKFRDDLDRMILQHITAMPPPSTDPTTRLADLLQRAAEFLDPREARNHGLKDARRLFTDVCRELADLGCAYKHPRFDSTHAVVRSHLMQTHHGGVDIAEVTLDCGHLLRVPIAPNQPLPGPRDRFSCPACPRGAK